MSQNTDPFPTPRGALSPEGVTAAVPCRHVRRSQGTGLLWACDDCGLVGGTAGMSQIVAGAKGAVPEPQEPITEAGRALYEALVDLGIAHAVNGSAGTAILAIEAEARATAPPDIDVEPVLRYLRSSRTRRDLAEAMGGKDARDNDVYLRMATNILAKLQDRRLASPDATPETGR